MVTCNLNLESFFILVNITFKHFPKIRLQRKVQCCWNKIPGTSFHTSKSKSIVIDLVFRSCKPEFEV